MFSFKTSFRISLFSAYLSYIGLCISPNPILAFFLVFNIINALILYYLKGLNEAKEARKAQNKVQVKDLRPND